MAKPYYWWNCTDLADEGLFDMIVREGADNLRLEHHPGEEKSLKLIDKRTGEPCGSYNVSHTCPPDCD